MDTIVAMKTADNVATCLKILAANEIAQGKRTRCEVLQEDQLSVSRFGPSV